jgi:hypothetical protein
MIKLERKYDSAISNIGNLTAENLTQRNFEEELKQRLQHLVPWKEHQLIRNEIGTSTPSA